MRKAPWDAGNAALSAQILGEFFVAATRRLQPPLSARAAEQFAVNLGRVWPVFEVSRAAALEAMRAVQQYQLSYWDALIWATARLNDVADVLTEDLPGQPLVEGVRFTDPFQPDFDLAKLD